MAYMTLYREWRPRTFREIIGQEHITRTLRNAVEAGRVGHAYLFCGTRGTGKTTTARVLAKAINCPRREGAEPCNRCSGCKAVDEGISLDVIEVDAASNRGIDEIRDLREKIKYAPTTGPFRVYIIDEVHMLSSDAFNALLKTLEEPPRHGLFILATTEPHKVPLTILSRCQRFDFRRIIPADIIRRLKEVAAGAKLEVEEDALSLIARAAEGGLRDALSILDQAAAFGGTRVTAEDVHNILGTVRVDALSRMAGHLAAGEAGPALLLAAELAGEGKDLRLFARELAAYMRMLLLEKLSPGAAAEEAWGESAQVAARSAEFTEEELLRAVEIMAGAERNMKYSTLPGVVLELALVKICRPEVTGDMSSFAARLSAVEEKLKVLAGQERLPGRAKVVPRPVSRRAFKSPRENIKHSPPGIKSTGHAEIPNKPETPPLQANPDSSVVAPFEGNGPVEFEQKRPVEPARLEVSATREVQEEPPLQQAEASTGEGAVTLEQVRESWENIINTLRSERLPLYHNYLKAVPLAVKDRRLLVGFPEGEILPREMAELPDNKKYLEGLLGKLFKGEWSVAFKYYKGKMAMPGKRQVPKEPASDVMRRFGGEEIKLEDDVKGTLF